MSRFIKFCEYILFFMFLVLILFLKDKFSILLTIPLIILLYFLSKKINIKNYGLFIFVLALILRIISIFILKVPIVDDFKTMYEASKNLIAGDISFVDKFYFSTFAYQLGHVLYQSLLLKIINSIVFLKIVNSIITSFIVLFIYLICKKIFDEKIARITSFAYLFYLYPLYLNSVLTNQHLPALLILIIIYIIINNKINIKSSILIALLLSIANIFRTESIVFILGITVYNLININKNNFKSILKNTSIMIAVYFVFNLLISQIVYISPLNTKLTNNSPYWKFYCGLSYKYNGLYNVEDQNEFFNSNNQKELLINRIKDEKIKLPALFLKKEIILWTQTNYDLRIDNNLNNSLYSFLQYFNQEYLNLLIVLLIISLFPNKKKKYDKILLIKIFLGIYYCVYMLIEISPRYAYILHILIFLIIGIGINRIKEFWTKLIHNSYFKRK